MFWKTLMLFAVPMVALAFAVSAVALAPGILHAMGPSPAATPIPAPTWKVGDSWTYNVSMALGSGEEILPQAMVQSSPMPVPFPLTGTLTMTVAGAVSTNEGEAWNTTLSGSLALAPLRPIILSVPTTQTSSLSGVTQSGFVWLRQSDLAPIYSKKTVQIVATWNMSMGNRTIFPPFMNGTYSVTYTATTEVSYHPALAIWQFPLHENATWDVRSNATIRYASTFEFQGPNVTFATNRSVAFTVPVDFSVHTGLFENVTTPAGTFEALPAWASRGPVFPAIPDPDASAMMNLTADTELAVPHGFGTSWFSAQAGNVVRVDAYPASFVGPFVRLDLVSYTYG